MPTGDGRAVVAHHMVVVMVGGEEIWLWAGLLHYPLRVDIRERCGHVFWLGFAYMFEWVSMYVEWVSTYMLTHSIYFFYSDISSKGVFRTHYGFTGNIFILDRLNIQRHRHADRIVLGI